MNSRNSSRNSSRNNRRNNSRYNRRMFAPMFNRPILPFLLLVSALWLGVLSQGCSEEDMAGFCNPISNTTAIVMMQNEHALKAPAPVTLAGVPFGEVREVGVDEKKHPFLKLCLENDLAEKLTKGTIFYISEGEQGPTLVCEIPEKDKTPPSEEMTFLGFASQADFLAWKTKRIVKKGVHDFLDAVNSALDEALK